MCEDAFENVVVCIKQIPFVSGIKVHRSVHTYFHYWCDLSGNVHSEVCATSWVELFVVHVGGDFKFFTCTKGAIRACSF